MVVLIRSGSVAAPVPANMKPVGVGERDTPELSGHKEPRLFWYETLWFVLMIPFFNRRNVAILAFVDTTMFRLYY